DLVESVLQMNFTKCKMFPRIFWPVLGIKNIGTIRKRLTGAESSVVDSSISNDTLFLYCTILCINVFLILFAMWLTMLLNDWFFFALFANLCYFWHSFDTNRFSGTRHFSATNLPRPDHIDSEQLPNMIVSSTTQPIRFYFTDQTRMLGSFNKIIKSTSSWRWRRLCCLPYVLIFEIGFLCFLTGICILTLYLIYESSSEDAIIEPTTAHVILITVGLVLCVAIVANLYTWTQMLQALLFSQRRHLQRAISHLDTLKSEGFLQALRSEVNLMTEMVKCLDSFTSQQTRLVIQRRLFIVILAIDPHVISKAVEVNSRRLFSESNIGGHDYLRNMVHLPFYLQNSGLRKVKVAQQTALHHRKSTAASSSSAWNENEESVSMAATSALTSDGCFRKGSRKLKLSMLVMKSFIKSLSNRFQLVPLGKLDSTSLKTMYDKVRPQIPVLKDVEPLLELDRDERKFDIFLTFHRNSLLVSDLKIFLPFTINLDPYIKKVIKEEQQSLDETGLVMGSQFAASPPSVPTRLTLLFIIVTKFLKEPYQIYIFSIGSRGLILIYTFKIHVLQMNFGDWELFRMLIYLLMYQPHNHKKEKMSSSNWLLIGLERFLWPLCIISGNNMVLWLKPVFRRTESDVRFSQMGVSHLFIVVSFFIRELHKIPLENHMIPVPFPPRNCEWKMSWDMAFPQINNISFWLLPPSLTLLLVVPLISSSSELAWTSFGTLDFSSIISISATVEFRSSSISLFRSFECRYFPKQFFFRLCMGSHCRFFYFPFLDVPEMSNQSIGAIDIFGSLPLIPAFQRFLSSHCPSSIPLFIMASYIPSYHALLLLPLLLLP
ncbi:hypothetical protein L9F63_026296, partial [Diploptera punctata]